MSDHQIIQPDGFPSTATGGGVRPDGEDGTYSHKQTGNFTPADVVDVHGQPTGSVFVTFNNDGSIIDRDGNAYTRNPNGLGVIPIEGGE